uniref:baseplate J/gp47 family protein n=1 Tax=Dialister hominis TaxID=2582419 RepID=UPI004025FC09
PVVPIDYVAGLSKVEITELVTAGEDEEETEAFRKRYLASFDSMAFGGNIQDYREKVGAIAGVGGVKVYPVWNGGGTVKIVFSTSDNKPPTAEKVTEVQTAIDPVTNAGKGIGIAPIGHRVTVEGAKAKEINISFVPSFKSGTMQDYMEAIKGKLSDYFSELNTDWESTQTATTESYNDTGLVIRISQIEARLLSINGLEDVSNTRINGLPGNLTLEPDELAAVGSISEGAGTS